MVGAAVVVVCPFVVVVGNVGSVTTVVVPVMFLIPSPVVVGASVVAGASVVVGATVAVVVVPTSVVVDLKMFHVSLNVQRIFSYKPYLSSH